ncbi:cupin domain-containing protein [Chitinolyticbacter meiyuanensis]|uniref:cupin domain-containing protein n=1 Tax=Chitinolyticbacter meiyuanensis TaxID=682798 RepID=UPI0011E588D5|nr:cupin domain-containing protein [Chitinolyticbacter meiyuanensis]
MRLIPAALLLLALAAPAHALDNLASVKATPLLKTTTSWNGAPLSYPAGTAEISGLMIEIPIGGETGWHSHPVPSFGYVLEGELEVSLQNGRKNRIKAGEALAEVVDTLHNGRNVGAGPVRLVVFYAGAKGAPLTEKPAQ